MYQVNRLHFRMVHTSQDHVLGTLAAKPEVFQPLATCLRRQFEKINLAIAQVMEFPFAIRISTLVDHHIFLLHDCYTQRFTIVAGTLHRRSLNCGAHQHHRRAMIAALANGFRASLTLVMCCSIIGFYGRPRMNIRLGRIHQRRSIPDSIPVVRGAKCCPWRQRTLRLCRIHRPYSHFPPRTPNE